MGILSELFWEKKQPAAPIPEVVSSAPRQAREDIEYADRDDYEHPPLLTLRQWDYGQGLDETTSGYGFVTPDGKTWPAGKCLWSTWDELGVLVIPVVGGRHHLEDLNDPSFDPGRPVRLFPEPDNPHDARAIAVRNWTTDKTAGYVKKGSTSRLRNLLRGHDLRVMALSCRYDQAPPLGRRESLKIAIFRPDRLVGAEHIGPHPPVVG
jgi:hypothetical protein